MKQFALVTLISFVGIAAFSAFAMGTQSEHEHGFCIISVAERMGCASSGSMRSLFDGHIEVFKSFSQALVFGTVNVFLLAMLLWATSIFLYRYAPFFGIFKNIENATGHMISKTSLAPFRAWLLVREHIPTPVLA